MSRDDRGSGTRVTFIDGKETLELRRCRLTVTAGPDAGLRRELESDVIRVGARKGADLVLSDARVSGFHFELRLEAGGYRLRDLDSTNGTRVSGVRVIEAFVEPGVEIALGETRILFEPLAETVSVPLSPEDRLGELVGRSAVMRQLFARVRRIAPTDATVVVTGETGSGKELVVQAIHELSPRAQGPLVVVDCGSIPGNLIESELFGHEKGAFTGAAAERQGAFERAHGGTLFLDELGELPLELQPKLLRALESRQIRRIGGSQTIDLDFRVVAATNRDLALEVNRGRFREDLYHRLAVVLLRVPPLRERIEDLPLLVEHFMGHLGGVAAPLRPETLERLQRHDWPGNVRELRNVIERAMILHETPRSPTTPGAAPRPAAAGDGSDLRVAIDPDLPFKQAKQQVVDEFERRYAVALLARHRGNVSAASRAAQIDRMSLHRMLQRVGIKE